MPPLQAEFAAQIAALVTLTALAPTEIVDIIGPSSAPEPMGLLAVGIPSDLLLNRPDLAAALARVRAADADVAAAVASQYPRLTITGLIGFVARSLTGFLAADSLTLLAGPSVSGPIFDFGRSRAHAEGKRAEAVEAIHNFRRTTLSAFSEVETNLAAAQARRRQMTFLKHQVAADTEAATTARHEYRRGLTDFFNVLDAEQDLLRSRDELIVTDGTGGQNLRTRLVHSRSAGASDLGPMKSH